jgi:TatA/E family protein of Tat protein translocase
MNFLGMGPLEVILVVVLALIVFGPAKLPEIAGQIGKAVRDFRNATSELSDEFNRTIQAELNEAKATIDETKAALTEVRSAVDSTMSETRSVVDETRAAVTTVPAPQRVAAPSVEANGTSTHEEATSTPNGSTPLADTTQWSWETSPAKSEAGSDAVSASEPAPISEPVAAHEAAPPPVSEEPLAEAEPQAKPKDAATGSRDRGARDELQPPY